MHLHGIIFLLVSLSLVACESKIYVIITAGGHHIIGDEEKMKTNFVAFHFDTDKDKEDESSDKKLQLRPDGSGYHVISYYSDPPIHIYFKRNGKIETDSYGKVIIRKPNPSTGASEDSFCAAKSSSVDLPDLSKAGKFFSKFFSSSIFNTNFVTTISQHLENQV